MSNSIRSTPMPHCVINASYNEFWPLCSVWSRLPLDCGWSSCVCSPFLQVHCYVTVSIVSFHRCFPLLPFNPPLPSQHPPLWVQTTPKVHTAKQGLSVSLSSTSGGTETFKALVLLSIFTVD